MQNQEVPVAIKEYGGKEQYASKAAMKKHEAKESPATEKKEAAGEMMKPCKSCKTPAKCMKAGECAAQKPKSKLLFAMGMK